MLKIFYLKTEYIIYPVIYNMNNRIELGDILKIHTDLYRLDYAPENFLKFIFRC